MSKLSNASNVISFAVMVTSYLALCHVFLTAYLNPGMEIFVTVNTYGEANFELILLALSAPFIWYGSNRFLSKELWRAEK